MQELIIAANKIRRSKTAAERGNGCRSTVNHVPDPIVPGGSWGYRNDANALTFFFLGEFIMYTHCVCMHVRIQCTVCIHVLIQFSVFMENIANLVECHMRIALMLSSAGLGIATG